MPGAGSRAKRRDERRRGVRAEPAPLVVAPARPEVDLDRYVTVAGPVAIALAAVAMVAWTWRTWPDPIVDYGRELYAAWQVSTGKTLYVDLVHFCGPLSVYL